MECIDEMFEGHTAKNVLEKRGISRRLFYQVLDNNVQLASAYARAQESRADDMAEETKEIADCEPDPARARNMIQARQWLASKYRPGKYGDRIEVHATVSADISAALSAARERVLPMCDLNKLESSEVAVSTALLSDETTGSKPDNMTSITVPEFNSDDNS